MSIPSELSHLAAQINFLEPVSHKKLAFPSVEPIRQRLTMSWTPPKKTALLLAMTAPLIPERGEGLQPDCFTVLHFHLSHTSSLFRAAVSQTQRMLKLVFLISHINKLVQCRPIMRITSGRLILILVSGRFL